MDLKLMVMEHDPESWGRLRQLVLDQIEVTRGEDEPSHAIWLDLLKAMANATDHPAPTIRDWMVARTIARNSPRTPPGTFAGQPIPMGQDAMDVGVAQRWADGTLPGQDPDKFR